MWDMSDANEVVSLGTEPWRFFIVSVATYATTRVVHLSHQINGIDH